MDLGIQNHVAVVTGGASGIGRACVERFAAEGCRVAIWDLSDQASDVAAQISSPNSGDVVGQVVDVTDAASIEIALASVLDQFGQIDHLVHSAAIGSGKFGFPFTNLTPDDWPTVLEVNIMGMTRVAHAVTPHMVEQSSGSMVFVASVAGQIGSPTDPPYSASKAANINFAQCMAKDLAGKKVRVNTVCPGMVKTPLNQSVWKAWFEQQNDETAQTYEEWTNDKLENVVPLGQWQKPEDIADMIVFLSSERAANVTGQTINVDGGYVMHW
ncbi:MAG: oxidoreductase [Planctomycetaceae bacterium]|nr:oxidoreductase [Planctomycetaceae bacterium]